MAQIIFLGYEKFYLHAFIPQQSHCFSSRIYVVLIGLEVCFFAKRVHILVKGFQDYQSLFSCRDNQGQLPFIFSKTIRVFCFMETINVIHLYFSKTIKVFCRAETIKVICLLFFQRLSGSFVLQRQSRSSALSFSKTIRVFCHAEAIKVICLFIF